MAWDTLLPETCPLPQTAQTLAIYCTSLGNSFKNQQTYFIINQPL
jgi:hypothetical protein